MSMNPLLASLYETPGAEKIAAATVEPSTEKVAQAEEFLKAAQANNIDLSTLSDDQLVSLWNATFEKSAAAEPVKGETPKVEEKTASEKEAAATAELQEKLAAADFCGRAMAHAYVQELGKIKEAGGLPPWLQKGKEEGGEKSEDKGGDKAPPFAKKEEKEEKKDEEAEKKASADFELSKAGFAHALNLVKEAGADTEQAGARMEAAFFLMNGAVDGTKVASAGNVEAAVHIRALELLEAAGYPIDWKV